MTKAEINSNGLINQLTETYLDQFAQLYYSDSNKELSETFRSINRN